MYIMEVNHLPLHCNWLKLSRNWIYLGVYLCAQRCVYLCWRRGFPDSEEQCKSSVVDKKVCVCAHIWTALFKGKFRVQYKLGSFDSICAKDWITTKNYFYLFLIFFVKKQKS